MKLAGQRLSGIIREIVQSPVCEIKPSVAHSFELKPDPELIAELSGWIGALTIRAILRELNIDEHRIFQWRPEHKYNQYLILNHYAPGCMAHTVSLSRLMQGADWVPRLRKLIAKGYFIKATLGFGSGRTRTYDRTTEIEEILRTAIQGTLLMSSSKETTVSSAEQSYIPSSDQLNVTGLFDRESAVPAKWILQKRLKLNREFRVHTFGRDILYGMTFRISGTAEVNSFRQAQAFTHQLLQRLPLAFLEGTLIGWDIGITNAGKCYVIEGNFTGFHPEYHQGFQTSGYFDEMPFGPILCAWFNVYCQHQYRVSINSVEDSLLAKFPPLVEFLYYQSIFTAKQVADLQQTKGTVAGAFVYLGARTDYLMVKLVSFLQLANIAQRIYIITSERLQAEGRKLFNGSQIKLLTEQSLLTMEAYKQSRHWNEKRRKKLCCDQAIKLTQEPTHLII